MPTKLAAVVAYMIGIAGAGVYFGFVLGVGSGYLPRSAPADGPVPWLVNLGLLILFAVQHSGMARRAFKRWWTTAIPPTLERAVYVGCSGVAIAVLTLGWQPLPGDPLWHGPLWIIGLSLAGAAGIGACGAGSITLASSACNKPGRATPTPGARYASKDRTAMCVIR